MRIIAHRGASEDAPENTMAAFRLAWEQGADGIEGDFRLTRDGHVVCFHDDALKRITGKKGRMEDLGLDEIRKLDAGSWKSVSWRGEKIPLLEDVAACVPPGKHFYIELKSGPDIIPALEQVVRNFLTTSPHVVVMSFDDEVISEARRCLAGVQVLGLKSFKRTLTGVWEPSLDHVLESLKRRGADGLNSNVHPGMGPDFARAIRDAGLEWHVWTVNDPQIAARLAGWGVESVTTNRPLWIRRYLMEELVKSGNDNRRETGVSGKEV